MVLTSTSGANSTTATPGSSTNGVSVTYSATLSAAAPGSGTPAGTVTFSATPHGGTTSTLCSGVALVDAVARCNDGGALNSSGSPYTVSATYNPSPADFTSSTASVTEDVSAATKPLSVLALPDPTRLGQTVLATAILSGSPSGGTVSFAESFDGGPAAPLSGCQNLAVVPILHVAVCLFTPPKASGPGTYVLSASYSGTFKYAPEAGSTTVTVMSPTSLGLRFSSPDRSGVPLTATATVSPAPNGGTVAFAALGPRGKVALPSTCSSSTVTAGLATCTFTPTAAGTYTVVAQYSGTALYGSSAATSSVKLSG
jgi:Bacterial Ig-like domain (group 3)